MSQEFTPPNSALKPQFTPLGDRAVVARFGDAIDLETHQKVTSLAAHLDSRPFPGMIEAVPAFTTVTAYYDPLQLYYEEAVEHLETVVQQMSVVTPEESQVVEIPVRYGGEYGPDLSFVAEHNGLSPEEVIEIHSSADYLVYMIGFAPGFPYLGGMPERIAAPRRDTPRPAIPAGSVGIAGAQTGVYPMETPGGWQIIGRTPLRLFTPDRTPPSLLKAGDRVRFVPLTSEEFGGRVQNSVPPLVKDKE